MAQLRLTRRGGIAGIPMEARLDTRELEPAVEKRVLAALAAADPTPAGGAGAMPDAFEYELESRDSGGVRRISFAESDVPDELRETLSILAPRLSPQPR